MIIPIIFAFAVTLAVLPYWIRRAREHNLTNKDMHKKNSQVAELGGIVVSAGIIFALLLYVALEVFYYKNGNNTIAIFASIASILIATMIGLVDDILGWKLGLRKYQKLILTLAIAIPIIVINAGHSEITLPFIGKIDAGLLYPFLLIPLGIIGASNGFNILAGYNGLEAGNGIVILSGLGFIANSADAPTAALLAFTTVGALIAFLIFNKYPARIFPGNTMTYTIGSIIAIVAIMGDIEKFALIAFTPYFFEGLLKARGLFQKESFAKLNADGSLDVPHKKFYSLPHIVIAIIKKIKRKAYEKEIVLLLWAVQLAFTIIASIVFYC